MSKIIQKKFAHLHHHSDQHPARSVEGLGEVEEARTQRRVNDEEHRAQGGGGAARVLVIQGVCKLLHNTQGVYTATWPLPSSCTSSWSPLSPSSRSPSAALLSLSSLSPGWSAAAAASIALLVSYHRWVRRSPQRVTHQCHFTGAGAESAVTRAGLWSRMIANLRSCVTSRSDAGLVTQMSLS